MKTNRGTEYAAAGEFSIESLCHYHRGEGKGTHKKATRRAALEKEEKPGVWRSMLSSSFESLSVTMSRQAGRGRKRRTARFEKKEPSLWHSRWTLAKLSVGSVSVTTSKKEAGGEDEKGDDRRRRGRKRNRDREFGGRAAELPIDYSPGSIDLTLPAQRRRAEGRGRTRRRRA